MPRARITLLALTVAALGGCSGAGPGVELCPGGCPAGQVCDFDSGRCVPARPQGCPADMGYQLSLAAGDSGIRQLAFYDRAFGDLVVADWRPGQAPQCVYVDGRGETPGQPGPDVGLFPDLALDRLERPVVAYFDRDRGRVKVARRTGTGWDIVTVPRTPEDGAVTGYSCALALDDEDLPHLAYLELESMTPEIAWQRSDGSWASEPVVTDSEGEPRSPPRLDYLTPILDLVLDAGGRPWVAFWDWRDGTIKVAGRGEQGWSAVVVARELARPAWLSAALDPAGNLALAFHDAENGKLYYAANRGGGLEMVRVAGEVAAWPDLPVRAGAHNRLLFGADGLPRVLYLEATQGDLLMASGRADGGFAKPQLLADQGLVGFFTGAALVGGEIDVVSVRMHWQDGRLAGELLDWQLPAGSERLLGGGSGP